MAPLTTTIDIDRPAMEVFAYVTDPTRFDEWQANVTRGRIDAADAHETGARCVTTRRIGFAERDVTSEVTHANPPREWGVRGIDGPIRADVDVLVDPTDDGRGSRLTITIDFQGHGIGKLIVPLAVRPQARKEMPANLQRVKRRLEDQAGDQPA
jgi:uncharacterized protein YndB with AHSA1/START domain